jgi:predicted alpha/beta hydrolase family esterase
MTLPLEEQSKEIQKKLKLAGVGSRPVVFITHSFGGLLLKQLLRMSADQVCHNARYYLM